MVGANPAATNNLNPWYTADQDGDTYYSFLGVSNDAYNPSNKTMGVGLYYSTNSTLKKNNFRSFTPPVRKDGQLKGYLTDLQTNFSGKQIMNATTTDLANWANAGKNAYGANSQLTQLKNTTTVRGDLAVKWNGQAWAYGALNKIDTWLTNQNSMTNYNVYRSTNGGNIVKDQVGNMYQNGRGIYRNGEGSNPGGDASSRVGGAFALILLRNLDFSSCV